MALNQFVYESLDVLAEAVHNTACEHGFWSETPHGTDPTTIVALAKLMLVTTEVAEAAEVVRNLLQESRSHLAEELADIIIRALDLSHAYGCDIGRAVAEKMEANRQRPYMHGKKA